MSSRSLWPGDGSTPDLGDALDVVDLHPAESSLLREIDLAQWGLVAGPAHPSSNVTIYAEALSGGTYRHYCLAHIPPSTTEMQVWILAQGYGTVTLTTSLGAITLTVASPAARGPTWVCSSWESDSADQKLPVQSSQSLAWSDIDYLIDLAADSGEDLKLYGLTLVRSDHHYST